MLSSPTQDTQATLLLCAKLGERYDTAQSLTTRQYSALARWLREHSLRPADLLGNIGRSQLATLSLREVACDQIERLLDRGAALGVMVERWTSRGVWIISRADEEYPSRYITCLQHAAPPILYGVGEHTNLQDGGLAMVGSRHASEEDLAFAQRVGAACAEQHIAVVSGGAKGIDSESMMAAINQKGTAVGVLAEGLGRAAIAGPYHESILDGRLTLISPYEPESRWQPFTAMDRNKLIYALADAALVVASSDEQGGTWSGAVEALKREQIPIYVKASGEIAPGNRKLIQSGALEFPELCDDLRQLFVSARPSALLFDQPPQEPSELDVAGATEPGTPPESCEPPATPASSAVSVQTSAPADDSSMIEAIVEAIEEPLDLKAIAKRLRIPQVRTKALLKRALEEGRVQKLKKPGRYAKASAPLKLFADTPEAAVNKRS